MTDTQLHDHVRQFVSSCQSEYNAYGMPMDEDFLTIGIVRFNQKLNEIGVRNHRLTKMGQDARRLQLAVGAMSRGKKRLFELSVTKIVTDENSRASMKGMNAEERKDLATLKCEAMQEDVDKWEDLSKELRFFMDDLDDQHRLQREGHQRLLATLWSVRVHGVLGEIQKDAPNAYDQGATMTHSVARDSIPSVVPPPAPYMGSGHSAGEKPGQQADVGDLDELLGEGKGDKDNAERDV